MNIRRFALVPALAVLAVGLAGCSTLSFSHVAEASFPDRAALMKDGDLVFREAWVPKDAQSIWTKDLTDKPGNIITLTSTEGVSSPTCKAGALTGAPKLTAGWWPKKTPDTGLVCKDWQVFEQDGDWFGWTN